MAGSKTSKQPPLMTPGQLITAFIFSNILFLILGMAIGKGDFSGDPTGEIMPTEEVSESNMEGPEESEMDDFYSLEQSSSQKKKPPIELQTVTPEPKNTMVKRDKEITAPTSEKDSQTKQPLSTKPIPDQSKSKKVSTPAPAKVTSDPASGSYYLQLVASKDRSKANEFLKRVQAKGYPATMIKEGSYYKVRLGNYPAKNQAVRMKVDIDKSLKIQSWIKAAK